MNTLIRPLSRTATTLAAACLALAGTCALAQQAGTYSGTTADGYDITLTLTTNEETGELALTGLGMGFNVTCAKSGQAMGYGIGAGGYAPVVGNSAEGVFPYPNLYAKIKVNFDAHGGAKGGFFADVPLYVDSSTSFKTENCASGRTTFTATLVPPVAGARAAKPLPAGTATVTALPQAR